LTVIDDATEEPETEETETDITDFETGTEDIDEDISEGFNNLE